MKAPPLGKQLRSRWEATPRAGYLTGLAGGMLLIPVVVSVLLRWATDTGSAASWLCFALGVAITLWFLWLTLWAGQRERTQQSERHTNRAL